MVVRRQNVRLTVLRNLVLPQLILAVRHLMEQDHASTVVGVVPVQQLLLPLRLLQLVPITVARVIPPLAATPALLRQLLPLPLVPTPAARVTRLPAATPALLRQLLPQPLVPTLAVPATPPLAAIPALRQPLPRQPRVPITAEILILRLAVTPAFRPPMALLPAPLMLVATITIPALLMFAVIPELVLLNV